MRTLALLLILCGALSACSPTFNWRDYASPDAPYRVQFPDKPASQTRDVHLDGLVLSMTMTGAEVEGTVFAVGSALAPDAARAAAALETMQAALLRNIGATPRTLRRGPGPTIDLEAIGTRNGRPVQLTAHFVARGTRVYQVIVLGAAGAEQVEQFMGSFKPE